MTTARFANLHDLDEIARATGVSGANIDAYVKSAKQASFYTQLKIRKRGRKRAGQFRIVHKAKHEWLGQLHRMVAAMIGNDVTFGSHVQGFIQQRSILTNARQHLGARVILHGDIQGFFDAITVEQVQRGLVSLGAPPNVAELLARAGTIDGFLRQGTRCSPAIANLVCRPLDDGLLALAGAHRATYTRYADDLTFSGEKVPDAAAVQAIVEQHGFKLRDGRCYLQHRGRSQFVTGLFVGDTQRARLPRRLKRRLRQILHFVEKFGTDGHFGRPGADALVGDALALAGMIRFVQSIEPGLARRLRAQYQTGSEKSWKEREDYQDDEPPESD